MSGEVERLKRLNINNLGPPVAPLSVYLALTISLASLAELASAKASGETQYNKKAGKIYNLASLPDSLAKRRGERR